MMMAYHAVPPDMLENAPERLREIFVESLCVPDGSFK
jgi:hypothetical protein